jgi:excisionase family DNA binding protein
MTRPALFRPRWTPEVEELLRELAVRKDVQVKQIDPFFTMEEVGKICRVSARTVTRWLAAGLLTHLKVGHPGGKATVRIRASELEAFIRRFSIRAQEGEIERRLNGGADE